MRFFQHQEQSELVTICINGDELRRLLGIGQLSVSDFTCPNKASKLQVRKMIIECVTRQPQ